MIEDKRTGIYSQQIQLNPHVVEQYTQLAELRRPIVITDVNTHKRTSVVAPSADTLAMQRGLQPTKSPDKKGLFVAQFELENYRYAIDIDSEEINRRSQEQTLLSHRQAAMNQLTTAIYGGLVACLWDEKLASKDWHLYYKTMAGLCALTGMMLYLLDGNYTVQDGLISAAVPYAWNVRFNKKCYDIDKKYPHLEPVKKYFPETKLKKHELFYLHVPVEKWILGRTYLMSNRTRLLQDLKAPK